VTVKVSAWETVRVKFEDVTDFQFPVSVGVKDAEITDVLVSVGVQEQVATPEVVALVPQPEIVVPPLLKSKFPVVVDEALIVTGEPYVTVVPPPGIDRESAGVALLTTIVSGYVKLTI
jgi:hypothetical protein